MSAGRSAGRSDSGATFRSLPLDLIDVPRRRMRTEFDEEAMRTLAASLQEHTQLQPVVVRADGDRYTLIAGERRLRAAKLLGWTSIDAKVHSADEADAYVIELVENVQREALSPAEEADAYLDLMQLKGWSIRELAASVGRSGAHISRRTRIFSDETLRAAVTQHGLLVAVAEELLAVSEPDRGTLIRRALDQGWDRKQVRAAMRAQQDPADALFDAARDDALGEEGDDALLRGVTLDEWEGGRPRGFQRVARDLIRMLQQMTADDLTDGDRRVLARLWHTIGELARERAGQPSVLPRITRE